ncbi:MAG: hypothetical protein QF632_05815 [Candidatus Woesearchaeota archaeon]|jgi:hypothetical protein|nr:hypothetical protein [Candidatus Woesearchaeota archaeon]MDP7457921.1 hypothetical protein [Candidatus Woesearchaeota archaeon]
MFNFLKGFFQKRVEKVKISQSELPEWFTNKTKPVKELLTEDLRILGSDIRQRINTTKASMDTLEAAELRNKNIPMRALQIMEGNRDAYVKRVTLFLQNIQPPSILPEVSAFAEKIKKDFESLVKSTSKEYQILQEFLADESRKVAQNIKELERLCEKIGELGEDEKLILIKEVEKNIKTLREKRARKELLEKTKEKKKIELDELNKVHTDLEKSIESLKKEPEYKKVNDLKEKRKEMLGKIKNKAAELLYIFSTIEKALRKYIRISFEDQKILASYLESPLGAIFQDPDFTIIDVLKKIRIAIERKKIELDSKKGDKTIKAIETLTPQWLSTFYEEYSKLKAEKEALDKEIDTITIESKIEANEKQKSEVKEFQDKLKSEIKNIEEDVELIDLDELVKEIRDKILELLNISTVITTS